MREFIQLIQILSSVSLVIFVLLQVRGTGFSRSSNSSSFTRRGVEKLVFRLTFVSATLFLVSSALSLFV